MRTKLEQMIKELANDRMIRAYDNAFKFRNEEDALYHAARFAQLKPGAIVQFRCPEGLCSAVFVQFDERCRAQLLKYDPKDGGHVQANIIAASIIFDDMPEEWVDKPACEDEGDEYEDEFPRT